MSLLDVPILERAKTEGRWLPGAVAALEAEGWRQADGVDVCATCLRGTTSIDPTGKPRHLRCFRAEPPSEAGAEITGK